MNLAASFLDETLPTNAFVETLRYCVVLAALLLLLFCTFRFLDKTRTWSAVGFGSLAFLAMTQEASVLGEPFVPWRLPLFILAVSAGLIFMYRDAEYDDRKKR